MKIAITDTCIFIDLHDLALTHLLFQLPLHIHTSSAVMAELYPEQQAYLQHYIQAGQLHIHKLTSQDIQSIEQLPLPAGLSFNDKSVLLLAAKTNGMVLSSDAQVRRAAGRQGIEYHGMLWLLDGMLAQALIEPAEAAALLRQLCIINLTFQHNPLLVEEIRIRLEKWSKET